MTPFMNADFLLKTDTAKTLYHDHAEKMPIIDYHCHIDPMEIYEDKRYASITEVWLGAFQTDSPIPGKIQQGSAWWFNDHKPGMEAQMTSLMSLGAMGSFNGMLTDSRGFLSYTRHEYFRRILCNLFGRMVENISYYNTLHYFRFDEVLK